MATVYFQLERSKTLKDGTHPIFLVVKHTEGGKEKRFRYYTGRTALKNQWLGKGDNKRVSAKSPGASITNSRLDNIRLGVDSILTTAKNLKIPFSLGYFKKRFQEEVVGLKEAATATIGFFEHLERFIVSKENIFQPATIKTYITLHKSLLEFQKVSGYRIEFESINHIFITLYTKHLIEDKKVINNTLAKRVATLKAFLTEMKKAKINTFSDFEDFEASRDSETTIMYLTESELMRIFSLQIPDHNKVLQHIKDAFCFGCFTGLRFSDWGNLRSEHIIPLENENGEQIKGLKFTMFKVHKVVTVPLNRNAVSIIEKYKNVLPDGKLLPVYSNQETNRGLKEIARLAQIDGIIQEVKKSGARRIVYSNRKYEILSCHDARNTFATLYLEKGGRPEVLQKLLGHSNIKQTMRYVKIIEKALVTDYMKTMEIKNDSNKVVMLKMPA